MYFAYGSNMASRVLAGRGIHFCSVDKARLDGYRLAFMRRSIRTGTGVADIVPDSAAEVWGVVYELADRDVDELDRKEGRPWAYEHRAVQVALGGDTPVPAFTYVVSQREPEEVPPSGAYVEAILEGAREHGLPPAYIALLESLGAVSH
jgi:cation transport regulator ChaC